MGDWIKDMNRLTGPEPKTTSTDAEPVADRI